MRVAIVDPVCDKREFQRSPARRALLQVLLADKVFNIDYYSNQDITAEVVGLGFPIDRDTVGRFTSISSFNPLWSKSLTFRRWDEIAWTVLGRYLSLERRAKRLGAKMLVEQTAGRLRRSRNPYDAVIAVNDVGLAASEGLHPDYALVYYSLEVYYEDHPHIVWDTWRKNIKERERAQFRKISLLIIQDEERARLMFEDMRQPFDQDKYVQLPVTHAGKTHRTRSDYLRRHYPELDGKKILLQQNVGGARRSEEIAKMAMQTSSEEFAIVFNGSTFADEPARYVQHKGFLDYRQLDMLVASADIGLVFYLDDNENDRLISHASGQLSHFTMLGVPVITSYTPSLERLVNKYNCGIVVKSVNDIYAAARQIMKNYEKYCAGAIACFDAEYDIANYRDKILQRLKAFRLQS
jgi:glycosyltransferase involved in cell wall biosynthesis